MITATFPKRLRRFGTALFGFVVAIGLVLVLTGPLSVSTEATHQGSTTLDVDGEQVLIYRDEYGVPHIFARSNRALFHAYGYVVAQDRLWQLELNRRAAHGRLAEILGPSALAADQAARIVGYTEAELNAQFARLDAEQQAIFEAYRDGINRYVREVVLPDPLNKLPLEFWALEIGLPAPWTTADSVAFAAFMARRFGEIGGRELTNQTFLNGLIATHGAVAGYQIFNDVRWINDRDAPVTVPRGRGGEPADALLERSPEVLPAYLHPLTSLELPSSFGAEALRIWENLGVPTKLGSYAWVVDPARSAEGSAMLYGGPQMGFSAPEVLHEVQLTGGNGFNVTGMAFAGVPGVLIGRNQNIAWTSTTATGDNVDIYVETLCDGGAGYVFNGVCQPFEQRIETIEVRGGERVTVTVLRSVHGPVVGSSGGFAFTQKRAHWQRELESVSPFLAFDRAQDLRQFERAVRGIVTSHNFLYADQRGNIAYWQAGQVPIRPRGFDLRLPLPGDGSAEWPGGTLPVPTSINPSRGWLANWNNKPSVNYDNADNQIFGKQFRLLDLDDRLRKGQISLEDMRDIAKDIARVGGIGREARYLKPYLLDALNRVPPSHPLSAQARHIVAAWNGNAFSDAISSSTLHAGQVIFTAFLNRMLSYTFGDELEGSVSEASTNMLIHVLDDALGEGSSVPPSRDYFNGRHPDVVISGSFDKALRTLGSDPESWGMQARGMTTFSHLVIGPVGSIPASNRATYAQIVVLSQPTIYSENIFSMGQSGFIRLVPPTSFELDPHFRDLLGLFRDFEYKPMRLISDSRPSE